MRATVSAMLPASLRHGITTVQVRGQSWAGDGAGRGVDIRADRGTPVRAPAGGTVTFAASQQEYGNTIILDHGQDVRSVYGHLSQRAVQQGDRVERGQVIGYSGNTGRSTGPHLHFTVLKNGRPVNPSNVLH